MSNEEKILQTLEQQGKTLEQHGRLLERQAQTLEQQGRTLEQHGKLLEALMNQQAEMRADITGIKSQQAEMRADITGIKSQQAEMHDLLQKVAVTQEAVVLPRLDLLAEGHSHLADTLAGKSRVETLEDDVSFLKTVVKALSQEVQELKKAQ